MSATDTFANFQPGLQTPVRNSFAITPSADDTGSVTFKAVAGGTLLPIRARQVYATGTTATLLIGFY